MKQYNVLGMSCAACSSRVENAVKKLDGVTECSVSLLTNSMTVSGNVTPEKVILAVEKAGYKASLKGETIKKDSNQKQLKTKLVLSIILSVILMYFSMGYSMWGFPVPKFIENPVSIGVIQLILALIIITINKKFFVSGFKGLKNKSPNMDTLVSLGSGVSFLYSLYVLFVMINADITIAHKYLHELYFESSAMILTLISVGKMLEERSKGKTTNAISSLMKLKPKTAIKLVNSEETEVLIEELQKGDLFVVKPGSFIPADGVVKSGESAVDESSLTGESIPVSKSEGAKVSAGTINLSGYIVCEATSVGSDTTLSKIIEMVSVASSTKAPIAKLADKVSGVFVPFVIIVAVVVTLIWILVGKSIGFSLVRGISVLVISCPCALGLATPVAIMVGNGVGAKNGILFKTAESLEETGRVKTVVLDKTGTITLGKPEVTDVWSENEDYVLQLAYSLESKSEHPLSKAVVNYGKNKNIINLDVDEFKIHPGNGITGNIKSRQVFGGNLSFAKQFCTIDNEIIDKAEQYAVQGKTPLFFGEDNKVLGVIAVADTVKETSKKAVDELKNMGINVVMLTGDNKKTAAAIAKQVGLDSFVSDVLPDGKEKVIKDLKKDTKVMMVGDGINDAPALTASDIGVSIGSGTDVAIDSSDVVLVKNDLLDIPAAIRLSKETLKNIKQNLFFAFCYNIVGIPLAAGAFIKLFNWELNPMFGAFFMSMSSFLVVSNALRLNFAKIYKKELKMMKKTIKIEGMMCPHCEKRVKEKLEEIDGVLEAVPNHKENNAVINLSKDVSDEVLISVIEAQGYKVIK